jgi:hypothetical protein
MPTIAWTAVLEKTLCNASRVHAALNRGPAHELLIHANNGVDSCSGKKSVKRIAWTAALEKILFNQFGVLTTRVQDL